MAPAYMTVLLAFAGLAAASYSCINFDVPMSFEAPSLTPKFPRFKNHYESVQFLSDISARDAAAAGSPFEASPVNITVDATIAAKYCSPKGATGETVQLLTHGIGFDHSYWDFGGPNSEYNYVKAATEAGYSTLSYDRMGTGKSSHLDPYTHQQVGPAAGVLATLTTLLREGKLSKVAGSDIPTPSKVAHVGHSYGSVISETFANAAPSLSDGLILTGFSSKSSYGLPFAISSNLHIAAEMDPSRFGNLDKGYLTWGDELSNQYSFLSYPYFDPAVLKQAEANKQPFAVSDFLTAFGMPAPDYVGPVMVSTILSVLSVMTLTHKRSSPASMIAYSAVLIAMVYSSKPKPSSRKQM